MASLNKVFLMGNLTRDPELRYTPSGTAIANFGLAINRRFKGKDGDTREDTCFVDVDAWARQAEVISEYCRKGRPLFIEGRLQLDSWQTKDGQKRSKLKVVLENFQFIGGRGEGQGSGPRGGGGPPASPPKKDEQGSGSAPESGGFNVDDDEIPF